MKKFSLISIFILLSIFKMSAQTGDGIKYLGDGIYTS